VAGTNNTPAEQGPANGPLETALVYLRAGLSVIPIRPDGSKRPALSQWERFQKQLPPENVVRAYWQDGTKGIAIIGGAVSGNLETIDFDRDGLFALWRELIEESMPGLVSRLCLVRTPRGPTCYHVRYRCREVPIPGNMKLAQEPCINPKTGNPDLVALIETRGEGGYALAPGCPPACHETGRTYEHVGGPPLTDLPEITAQEREILIAAARSFDLASAAKAWQTENAFKGRAAGGRPSDDLRPGDDFNQRGPDWSTILGPHGWEWGRNRGAVVHWRRPGKNTGYSATTGYCKGEDGTDLLAVFSSNASPFEGPNGTSSCTCYSKFRAYALLNHNGDLKAAALELRRQGYGNHTPGAGGASGAVKPARSLPYRPFPVQTLPEPLRSFVEQAAEALGCDPSFVALPALAVCAALVGNTRVVRLKKDWTEPAILWTAIVGDSGTLKSPAIKQALGPVFRLQKQLRDEYETDHDRYLSEKEVFDRKKKERIKKGEPPGDPPERPSAVGS
jgi:hypothetical protein